jgi:signal transduction histidine kinase
VAEPFNQTTARYLTASYVLALTVVGLLIIIAQIAVQEVLHRQRDDAMVINLAGRQRMLSQELVKSALAWDAAADAPARAARAAEIRRVVSEWTAANTRLVGAETTPGMGRDNPPAVAAALASLQPELDSMVAGVAGVSPDGGHLAPGVAAKLLGSEDDFLPRMDAIVHLYQDAAAARVHKLSALEFVLCLILLAVLAAEALVVFRPTVRHLHGALAERERLRDQEQDNRELMIAAEVARGIGFDLHDGVGQSLTALALQARALEDALAAKPDAAGLTAQVAALRAGLKEALVQTRAAARRLSPIDIQAAGLDAALRDLAESSQQVSGLRVSVDCHPGLVTGAAAEDLYHIAQEAITNAIRHSHGTAIAVTLRTENAAQSPGQLRLEIADDGDGGPVPAGDTGVGLRSMRHRARRLGGWLVLGPRPPRGWAVILTMPLPAPDAKPARAPGAG